MVVVVYAVSVLLNYCLLRRNYLRHGKPSLFILVLSVIPIINTVITVVIMWIEIEETITYDRFLQLIFFVKTNKDVK